jgi:hypothetical protein
MDTTPSTNHLNFHLGTLMVQDSHGNAVPVMQWFSSRDKQEIYEQVLGATCAELRKHMQDWAPAAWLVDCASAAIAGIKQVFGSDSKIYLCMWHVKRAWHKNIISRRVAASLGPDIWQQLQHIMCWPGGGKEQEERWQYLKEKMDSFVRQFRADAPEFVRYMEDNWFIRAEAGTLDL